MATSLWRAVVLLPLALSLSCADMPTGPKAIVRVEGEIRDRDGVGIPGARVIFRIRRSYASGGIIIDPRAEPDRLEALTGADGSYTIAIPENRYAVDVLPPYSSNYAPALVEGVAVNPKERRFDFRFDWLRLAVRIDLKGDEPISDVSVSLFPWWTYGLDYYFYAYPQVKGDTLEMFIPPGKYTIRARAQGTSYGYAPFDSIVRLDYDSNVSISMDGNVVSAQVTGQGGAAMGGAQIYALGNGGASATADASGTATLYLPSAGYTVDILPPAENIEPQRFPYVSVTSDMLMVFALPGVRWNGRIVDDVFGEPLANFQVFAGQIGGVGYARSITDAAGYFEVVVRPNSAHDIYVGTWLLHRKFSNVIAVNDSTFDLYVPRVPPQDAVAGPLPRRNGASGLSQRQGAPARSITRVSP